MQNTNIGIAPIVECVPNFSEGRDANIINEIAKAIAYVSGVKVLHVDMGADANRTVITFAGSPNGVEEAAFQAVKKATELIDMNKHNGTHPRIGACDVLPLIPISEIGMDEVVALSYRLSKRIGEELKVPVYNYEKSARKPQRVRLEQVRTGEYEGLEAKMSLPEWQADNRQPYNANTGATVLGARPFLLAYNVNIGTRDVSIAKAIATAIRESGKIIDGKRIAGILKGVKAIGWDVPEYGMVQVSTNITDTEMVGLHDVFEEVKRLAASRGVEVCGSELIGLTPKRCLLEAGEFYGDSSLSEEEKINIAIERLGLTSVDDFVAEKRIIEYML